MAVAFIRPSITTQFTYRRVQSLATQAEVTRTELRDATARAALLQNDSADARERATAARRRIPELEGKKKAAAASRVRHGACVF